MSELPAEFDQLSPDSVGRVDKIRDTLEQAWKAAGATGDPPPIATYLDGWTEPERTILARELIALDRACRRRYGLPAYPDNYEALVAKFGTPLNDLVRPRLAS